MRSEPVLYYAVGVVFQSPALWRGFKCFVLFHPSTLQKVRFLSQQERRPFFSCSQSPLNAIKLILYILSYSSSVEWFFCFLVHRCVFLNWFILPHGLQIQWKWPLDHQNKLNTFSKDSNSISYLCHCGCLCSTCFIIRSHNKVEKLNLKQLKLKLNKFCCLFYCPKSQGDKLFMEDMQQNEKIMSFHQREVHSQCFWRNSKNRMVSFHLW